MNDPAMTQSVYLLLFVTIGAAVRILGGGRKARVTGTVTAPRRPGGLPEFRR